jgi:hypothetical protein
MFVILRESRLNRDDRACTPKCVTARRRENLHDILHRIIEIATSRQVGTRNDTSINNMIYL